MIEYNEHGVANNPYLVFEYSDKICSIKITKVTDNGVNNYGIRIFINSKVICGVGFPVTKDRVFSFSDLKEFCNMYFEQNLGQNSNKYFKIIESIEDGNKSEFIQLTLF